MARTLLIDGDIIVYRSTAAVEKEIQWDEDTFTIHSSLEDALAVFDETLHDLRTQAETDEVVFTFSDKANWRKAIEPTYKAHRKDTRKPLAYNALVEYAESKYESVRLPNLEADDVLGLMLTGIRGPEYILWSLDKDLKQIPGLHLIDDEIVEITEAEGSRFHLYQTLVGDASDGYKGCPGIGPVKAEKLVDGGWEAVSTAYVKAGLAIEDAIHQARLARILRHGEYNFETGEVNLWTP